MLLDNLFAHPQTQAVPDSPLRREERLKDLGQCPCLDALTVISN